VWAKTTAGVRIAGVAARHDLMSLEAMVFTLSQVSISQERLQNTSGKNK
jgi:hypothetical protein